jgi:uncharacterized protein YodC (DUF2158 family)
MTISRGCTVQLKTGGPKMMVKHIIGKSPSMKMIDAGLKMHGYKDGQVYCTWNVRNHQKFGVFSIELLKEIDE